MSQEFDRFQCVLKAQFNPASLTGSYQPMNGAGTQSNVLTVGFSDNAKILKIYNPSTTVSIDVSLDGVNDHDFIPPLGTLIVDFQANHKTESSFGSGTLSVGAGQIIFGKTAAQPTYLQIVGYR